MGVKEKLYSSFAELIYAIAMADGILEDIEKEAIENSTNEHPIQGIINQLFEDDNIIEEVSIVGSYKNIVDYYREYGEDEEYAFLINILEELSKACKTDEADEDLIDSIIDELKEKLIK